MTVPLRRGLPRVAGGEPWPPAGFAPAGFAAAEIAPEPAAALEVTPALDPTASIVALSDVPLRRGLPRVVGGEPWPAEGFAPVAAAEPEPEPMSEPEATASIVALSDVPLRRGLPRVVGGEPWPAEGFAPATALAASAHTASVATADEATAPMPTAPVTDADGAPAKPRERHPLARRIVLASVGLLGLLAVAVLIARWLVTLEPVQEFLAEYPGGYALPEGAPVGIPAWLSWQHFFNMFLLVLIVRTGVQIRRERRPEAYFASRRQPQRKISLTSWTHQALDLFWVINGAVYIVLLFATGQWMRIVPTSWSVFPNAISTTLQYLSLDWPQEHSWLYYNSLQQLGYFVVVFIASPLAIASGIRMSQVWRARGRLDRLYPASAARMIHFPVMVFFLVFLVLHVSLVLATGARANLNHMYAGTDEVNWVGTGIFALSIVAIVAAVLALRPLLLAPIASRFGTVTSR